MDFSVKTGAPQRESMVKYMDIPVPSCLGKIRYENNALRELFGQFSIGIFLLSDDKTVFYYNDIAEEFYSVFVSTRFNGPIIASGGVLYSMFLNKSRKSWMYYHQDKVYSVSVRDYQVQADMHTAYCISVFVSNQTSTGSGQMINKYKLSQRQLEIAGLILDGYTNSEIAEELYLSIHTVNKHIENLFRKTGVSNRMAAAFKVYGGGEPLSFTAKAFK